MHLNAGAAMDGAKCTAIKGFTFGGLKLIDPAMIKMLRDDIYKIEPFVKSEKFKTEPFVKSEDSKTMSKKSRKILITEDQNEEDFELCGGIQGTQSVHAVLCVRFKICNDDLENNAE